MPRTDINDFANDLLLDFVDLVHEQIRTELTSRYGSTWFDEGVRKHINPAYLDRTREMLESPMRVVDMGKTDEELFGVEHLWNIVSGNWKSVFEARFRDRRRTEVYFGEIAEVRHNVSHRRRRHFLRRPELVRLAQNCSVILKCLSSPKAYQFEEITENLTGGASPWGAKLEGHIPAQDEVVGEFVGRDAQLRDLNIWLATDTPQLLVWGYGGAGKSALAFEFARETKEIAPRSLDTVAWVSAKRREYVGGEDRPRKADFSDRPSLVQAIFSALFELDVSTDGLGEDELLAQLREMPALLIVDDYDTVIDDEELVEFLMHDVRATGSRVLYTSRQKVVGLRSIEVLGFEGEELEELVRLRAWDHGLDPESCVRRLKAIHSVTGGFPLFVDDLLRYARLSGVDDAVSAWSQRKGDAAREYALRRQLQQLGASAQDVLIALSVADRPLTTLELGTLAGLTDEDAEQAVHSLLDWRLIGRVPGPDETRPSFAMNLNTMRLVQRTYGGEPRVDGFRSKFRALHSTKIPAARSAAIASAIGITRSLVMRGDVEAAISELRDRMTGELANSADLYGALGWAYSRAPKQYLDQARHAFERAYELGNTKEDTFVHWATMESEEAESVVGHLPEEQLLGAWRRCARAAELGVRVCGMTRALCQLAGYAHTREAKTLERQNQFMQAHGAYAEGADWLRRALEAPPSLTRDVPRGVIYRGLALAQEGMGEVEQLRETLTEWSHVGGSTDVFRTEYARLAQKFPQLADLPAT